MATNTSITDIIHGLIDISHHYIGSGFDRSEPRTVYRNGSLPPPEPISYELDRTSLFRFVKTAPMAAADQASLPLSVECLKLDQLIEERMGHGFASALVRTLVLILSAVQRSVVFAAAFCTVGSLCVAGTVTGILPAYFYFCGPQEASAVEPPIED